MNRLETPPGPVFIAFSGKKQVGKDTATAIAVELLEKRGYRVAVTAFAEELKNIAINVIGISRDLVYGSNDDKENLTHVKWDKFPLDIRIKYALVKPHEDWPRKGFMTVREVLQVIGTDIFRDMIDPNVWSNAPFNKKRQNIDVVIITDCRFPNEKVVTEKRGGLVIRLERATGFQDDHYSETALDGEHFDVTYDNNGTLEDLKKFIEEVLDSICLKTISI